jgi:hypothetical protein
MGLSADGASVQHGRGYLWHKLGVNERRVTATYFRDAAAAPRGRIGKEQ